MGKASEQIGVGGDPANGTSTRILDAAEGLFADAGFAGVSVREIAGAVGLIEMEIVWFTHHGAR